MGDQDMDGMLLTAEMVYRDAKNILGIIKKRAAVEQDCYKFKGWGILPILLIDMQGSMLYSVRNKAKMLQQSQRPHTGLGGYPLALRNSNIGNSSPLSVYSVPMDVRIKSPSFGPSSLGSEYKMLVRRAVRIP